MSWIVLTKRPARRGSLSAGTAPTFEWVPCPGHPQPYATAAQARRALMVSLMPELSGHDDAQIERHYKAWQRNVNHHKLTRI